MQVHSEMSGFGDPSYRSLKYSYQNKISKKQTHFAHAKTECNYDEDVEGGESRFGSPFIGDAPPTVSVAHFLNRSHSLLYRSELKKVKSSSTL